MPVNGVNEIVESLRNNDNFSCISINSTLGSCLGAYNHVYSSEMLIHGEERGEALIICNKIDREDWEIQFSDAKFVVEQQLGLKVLTSYFNQ